METGVMAAEKFSFAITGTLRFKYIKKKKKKKKKLTPNFEHKTF